MQIPLFGLNIGLGPDGASGLDARLGIKSDNTIDH